MVIQVLILCCKEALHAGSWAHLLGLIVGSLTDAVELFRAALLAPFTLHADVVVHLLRLLFRDAHTLSVIPVGTQVAANVEPSEKQNENVNDGRDLLCV